MLRKKLLEMIGSYIAAEGGAGKQTGLNQYQKKSVEIVLREMERTIDTIEAMLAADKTGILYSRTVSLSPEQRSKAAELIGKIRAEITELAAMFDLTKQELDGRQAISSMLGIVWEGIEDTHAEKLDRYGNIDPDLPSILDPHIDRLIDTVLTLSRTVTGNESTSSQDP
ncbi:MAG: hypothetical protein M1389_04140 [Chloroflexi bacterium]|nr:hypothetical protein [Chloroflexota bacterium]